MTSTYLKIFICLMLAFGALWVGCWFLSICPHWAEPPTFMSMFFCFFGGIGFAAKEVAESSTNP